MKPSESVNRAKHPGWSLSQDSMMVISNAGAERLATARARKPVYVVANALGSTVRPASVPAGVALPPAMSPIRAAYARLSKMSRTEPWEFAVWLIGLFGGIYMVLSSAIQLGPQISAYLSIAAVAQDALPATAATPFSSRDAFDWFIGGLMGIALLISLGLTVFAKKESKIAHGKDLSKIIIGFIVGFLSGGGAKAG